MSQKITNEDVLSPRNPEENETARKKMRHDHGTLKNWGLTDKHTDQEVLQEMGLSLLDPDALENYNLDTPSLIKSSTKRKRDIENVNPNVNSATKMKSPKRSPKTKSSPVPGPSGICSPAKSIPEDLESTILQSYIVTEEETPAGQCGPIAFNGEERLGRGRNTPLKPLNPEIDLVLSRRSSDATPGVDSFNVLSDEVMLNIFKWLGKRTLANCMLVCKRWHRIATDETFWQRLELGNRNISKDSLGRILDRKPIIVRFAGSEIGEWHPNPNHIEESRIQYLDLSMCTIDIETLQALVARCGALRKLSVEGVAVSDAVCMAIGKCSKMETLNLTMATGITDVGLRYILEGCPGIISLNLAWCNLSMESLELLSQLLPVNLQRLNLAGARLMTDEVVSGVCDRCPHLSELDISDCGRVGSATGEALRKLRVRHLAISRCYRLPAAALPLLNSIDTLEYLEVWGMLQESSLRALNAALPHIQINQFMHSAIARPTVGTRRTSIWGLRTRD